MYYVFYGHCRRTGKAEFLFNIEARSQDSALNLGQKIYRSCGRIIQELYTIERCFVEKA